MWLAPDLRRYARGLEAWGFAFLFPVGHTMAQVRRASREDPYACARDRPRSGGHPPVRRAAYRGRLAVSTRLTLPVMRHDGCPRQRTVWGARYRVPAFYAVVAIPLRRRRGLRAKQVGRRSRVSPQRHPCARSRVDFLSQCTTTCDRDERSWRELRAGLTSPLATRASRKAARPGAAGSRGCAGRRERRH